MCFTISIISMRLGLNFVKPELTEKSIIIADEEYDRERKSGINIF